MSITRVLQKQVLFDVKQRGQSYFDQGRVDLIDADDWEVLATVHGSSNYEVHLHRAGSEIRTWCDCQYFQDNGAHCKHIWATLLAAQVEGCLYGDGNDRDLELVEDLDEEDDFDAASPIDVGHDSWRPAAPRKPHTAPPAWWHALAAFRGQPLEPSRYSWPDLTEAVYIVSAGASGAVAVELAGRARKKNGEWATPKNRRLAKDQIGTLPTAVDRHIVGLLAGAETDQGYSSYYYRVSEIGPRFQLSAIMAVELLPHICQTGRCFWRHHHQPELAPLQWDDGPPWTGRFQLAQIDKHYHLTAELVRDGESLSLAKPLLMIEGGLVILADKVARLDDGGHFVWLNRLRQTPLTLPAKDQERWLPELLALPGLPKLEMPAELQFEEVTLSPAYHLRVSAHPNRRPDQLIGALTFRYGDAAAVLGDDAAGIYHAASRQLIRRDADAERQALALLAQHGMRYEHDYYAQAKTLALPARQLPKLVQALTTAGWQVEADGKLYRQSSAFKMEVRSGIDWFELHGTMAFDDQVVTLPELLAALRKGENSIRLGDGSLGMLPEDWLKKHGLLVSTGKTEGDHLRFQRAQVGLLDALLAAQPDVSCDKTFERAREELRSFDGIAAAEPPAQFQGELRGYQKEGLGWLHFLQRFGLGGCLADDMGLGKTVMVLALLEARRQARAKAKNGRRPPPSLAVVPRSLIFNWREEARRFTPKLRVLDHTGGNRLLPGEHFENHDLVLTTYGTLRRDAAHLKDIAFDYCILDEAQAVKNANTDSAKAVRLLQAQHRLVLSGTPVENHLGELWSLLDFLNPGMLGGANALRLEGGWRNPSPEARQLLGRALRPVILRRTKEQVAQDLPAKTEQTIWCELDATQRRFYNELRDYYRQSLLARVQRDGMNKAKMHVLEALLRLRQAACHPGLIDKKLTKDSSGKLEALMPQLAEVIDGGHKVLLFSQFTSMLAIVRDRLDREKIAYQYLDGRTRNRQACVDAFQNDPSCKLFLISLKAGGVGLNLTAAEYVFLLDPWWNPAVEAQAIDRAHRIGQDKPVFAYRLIAKDTVEEKVLELQQHKRALADAILSADNSLIRTLGREDLELLLS